MKYIVLILCGFNCFQLSLCLLFCHFPLNNWQI
nr:MAG TPA: hypothetical protein [Caudoviricetes sp.]